MRHRRWLLPSSLAVLAVLAAVPWLLAVHWALSPDEAGFLTLSAQWHHGTSLYGDYWVDRPPGLIGLYALVHLIGGGIEASAVPLRLLGALAAAACVPLARWIGGSMVAAVLAAAMVATPLVDAGLVDGEILAVPFVLLGLVAAVRAARADAIGAPARAPAALAGVAGVAALLVKQNFVDVFVVASVLAVVGVGPLHRRLRTLATTLLAGAVTLVVAVGLAATRGTTPAGLWEAMVVFRVQASAVIHSSGPPAAATRFSQLMTDLVHTQIPLAVLLLAGCVVRRLADANGPADSAGPDLRWPALALVAWETFGVLAGGSYWHHYLIGLLPGVALLATAATQARVPWRRPSVRLTVRAPVAVAVVAAAVVAGSTLRYAITTDPPTTSASTDAVQDWLTSHTRPGQTGFVAYGRADLLAAAGLRSPYEYLWGLPLRVRDPHLTELAQVLSGPDRPTWVVLYARPSLDSWGLSDLASAETALAEHYVEAGEPDGTVIYRARGAEAS